MLRPRTGLGMGPIQGLRFAVLARLGSDSVMGVMMSLVLSNYFGAGVELTSACNRLS